MKKFVTRIIVGTVLTLIILCLIYGTFCLFNINFTKTASDIFYCIEKSKEYSGCSIVYLGDSVCDQLWSRYTNGEDECHLASNAGAAPAGNYLLLCNYLDNNPQTRCVYYFVRPMTLKNKYRYVYMVLPFCGSDMKSKLPAEYEEQINNIYGEFFVKNDLVKATLINNNLLMEKYLNFVDEDYISIDGDHILSAESAMFIKMMDSLCKEKGIDFCMRADPLKDVYENHDLSELAQEIEDYELQDVMGDYMESIHYYPADWYADDAHFKNEILIKYGDEIREACMENLRGVR